NQFEFREEEIAKTGEKEERPILLLPNEKDDSELRDNRGEITSRRFRFGRPGDCHHHHHHGEFKQRGEREIASEHVRFRGKGEPLEFSFETIPVQPESREFHDRVEEFGPSFTRGDARHWRRRGRGRGRGRGHGHGRQEEEKRKEDPRGESYVMADWLTAQA
ncbi:hypothetical protein KI387_000466, partial [Taxus chinensis]